MKSNTLASCAGWMCLFSIEILGQTNCIEAPATVCIGECHSITYIGPGSPTASYQWTISCGSITNPNDQNPHTACFNQSGVCTIKVVWQDRGQAKDSCFAEVVVFPLPQVKLSLDNDSICLGSCTYLRGKFTGAPPFVFQLQSNNDVTRHVLDVTDFELEVCPDVPTEYSILVVTDANCSNPNPGAKQVLTVLSGLNASIQQKNNVLCAFPEFLNYKWNVCGDTMVKSNVSCFAPDVDGCYCVEVDDRICRDTSCIQFACDLTCTFDFPDTVCIGDPVKIVYNGNAGPFALFNWLLDIDLFKGLHFFNVNMLDVIYTLPGCYPIQLNVKEGNCVETCTDTICVIEKPCSCDSFTTNYVYPLYAAPSGCCFEVGGDIASLKCFTSMKVIVNNGVFTNIQASANWFVSALNPNTLQFLSASGTFPPGNFIAGSFCVSGASGYIIDVIYYYSAGGLRDSCTFRYIFDCPWPPDPISCDSLFSFLERQHTLPSYCCYNIHTDNPYPNTFNQVLVTIQGGSFSNVQSDVLSGYNLITNNIQDFSFQHSSGFIPSGMSLPAWFCVTGATNPVIVQVHYIAVNAPGNDTCTFEFQFDCPQPDQSLCCDSTTVILQDIAPGPFPGAQCCYNVMVTSATPKCFSKICFSTSSGILNNINANAGWNAISTPNGFCFVPAGLFVPAGPVLPGTFCVTGASNPVYITVDFYDINGNVLDSCRKVITKECPIPPPACHCDSLRSHIQTISSLPGLCCYDLTAQIPAGNCFQKIQLSLSAGQFNNVTANSGFTWTGNTPQDICYVPTSASLPVGAIHPGTFCVTGANVYSITAFYFYNNGGISDTCMFTYHFDCPPPTPSCSCDSLQNFIVQTSSLPGLCCYSLSANIPDSNCMSSLDILLSAGSFINVQPATGWTMQNNSAQSISLMHNSGFIPSGPIQPVSFCVAGANLYSITVHYYFISNGFIDTCRYTKTFDCPVLPDTLCHGSVCASGTRAWQTVALGLTHVYDMEVYQCRLIVAGQFTQAGSTPANNIAAWDGANWTALGQGVQGIVRALEVHNGILYVGGLFNNAGNLTNVNNIASWNGSNWNHLDNGLMGMGGAYVRTLLSTNSGLVIGGDFQTAGLTSNVSCQNIVNWNGSNYSNNYNNGFNGPVYSLSEYNGQLIAGGSFTAPQLNIAAWNGTNWTALSAGITFSQQIISHGVHKHYTYLNNLMVGGRFKEATTIPNTQNIAVWNGFSWFAIPGGDLPDTTASVNDFLKFGNKLYVGGEYSQIGNQNILGVAEWDGISWATTNHGFKVVRALEAYDSCGAITCDLYAGGEGFLNKWICVSSSIEEEKNVIAGIYPNPTHESIRILWKDDINIPKLRIDVKDLQGRLLNSFDVNQEYVEKISFRSFPSGMYILEFRKKSGKPERYLVVKM